jgi:multiple sugar transport system ATP-binding protein
MGLREVVMAEVVLNDVSKVYPGGVQAVANFDLAIRDGEFVVLVGPSGCGKSTTLRMVAGLEEISGDDPIGDRIVNDVHPKDRDIAMVFQNYALYPHMSVEKNMAFALRFGRSRGMRSTAASGGGGGPGIDELLKRRPKALSGGQRQRVALGRAIVREPAAFLFDEPLSNLDAKLRVETRAELKASSPAAGDDDDLRHARPGRGDDAGRPDRRDGKGLVQQVAPPLEVYRTPVNRFVAGFVGTPPMNFLTGTLERHGEEIRFVEGPSGTDGEAASITLPGWSHGNVMSHLGRKVVLGVRPEAMSQERRGNYDRPGNRLPVIVRVIEPLGDTMDLVCQTERHRHIVARVPARADTEADSKIDLFIDTERLHLFEEGEDSINLMHPPKTAAVGVG